jgi:hypothetical protein
MSAREVERVSKLFEEALAKAKAMPGNSYEHWGPITPSTALDLDDYLEYVSKRWELGRELTDEELKEFEGPSANVAAGSGSKNSAGTPRL